MFSKILFHYDMQGKLRDKPFELYANDVRGKSFNLISSSYRALRSGEYPSIDVCRIYADLKTDPYNEDGRPPSVWTRIVMPQIQFLGSAIEIFGLGRSSTSCIRRMFSS